MCDRYQEVSLIVSIMPSNTFHSLAWSLQHAKKIILEEFNNNLTKKPVYLDIKSKKWDRVFVEGNWDNSKQILIDNVIHRGISGFKVLTPLHF